MYYGYEARAFLPKRIFLSSSTDQTKHLLVETTETPVNCAIQLNMLQHFRPAPGALSIVRSRAVIKPSSIVRCISLKPDFSKLKKIEQPPGFIVGTVNEPYKPPGASFYEGGYHWTYERFIAISLVPLAMSPFIGGVEHPMIDSIFSIALLFHCHTGFKSCIIDYIPKRVYGIWYGLASKLLTFGTFVGMYGVYLLETESNGLFELIRSIWNS